MDKGWVKVYRKLLTHPIWLEKPFSKGQALVDLIALMNHEQKTIILGNAELTIQRGQHHTSELKLADRWGWSRKKVRAYLNQLERLEMVTTVGTSKGTTITVENYEKFQGEGTTEDTTQGTEQEPHRNRTGTAQGTQTRMKKNIKNDKNDKEVKKDIIPYPLEGFGFSSDIESKIKEWVAYKAEKKDAYTVIGFKKLMAIVKSNVTQYGDSAVMDLIDGCMASNWKGIIWDKLQKEGKSANTPNNTRNEKEVTADGGPTYDYGKFYT